MRAQNSVSLFPEVEVNIRVLSPTLKGILTLAYRKSSNKPPFGPPGGEGRGLNREGGGACLKFFDRQRQKYTTSMEFEMLRSFDNNYELLHYTKLSIYIYIYIYIILSKTEKQK